MSKTRILASDLEKMEAMKQQKEGETAEVLGTPQTSSLATSVPETLTRDVSNEKTPDGKKVKSPFDIVGAISIRPYIDGNVENMGLEEYGLVLFPGTFQEEQLAALERQGKIRYINGLDEYASEVQLIDDPELKEAVIKQIRTIVSDLEKRIATNIIKIDDEEFWNKATTLRPDNIEFWSQVSIRCGNDPVYLNPKADPYDLIKLMAIEAGGFDLIAKSWEDARTRAVPPKFYLDKEIDTSGTRVEYKRLKNKATSLLEELFENNPKKLLYVTKVVDAYSAKYKNSTPINVLYDEMDEYVSGNGAEKNKMRAANQFVEASKLDMETLKLKAMIKDASFYKFITPKADGMIYHTATNAMLGRNVADVLAYLKNPLHEDILTTMLKEVEHYWNQ